MSNCTYKVKIKDIQNNYKVIMEDIQNKYKFKIFCTGNSYDDTEIREEIEALQDELYDAEEELEQYKTIYNALPKVTGEGSNITLNNTANSVMKFKEYKGDTYQETTTGKNLLNTNNIATGTANGITISYDTNTQEITLNGTCSTDNTQITVSTNIIPFISGTTKVIGYYVSGSLTNSGIFRTFSSGWSNYDGVNIYQLNSSNPMIVKTTTFNVDKNLFSFRFDSGAVATNFKIKLMITDSDNTDFEKFTYGASPNPSYPQNIEVVTGTQNVKVCGKNLLPFPYTQSSQTHNGVTYTVNNDGSVLVNGTATGGNANIKLLGNYQEINQVKFPGKYLSGGTSNVRLRALNNHGGNYITLANDTGSGAEIDTSTYDVGYVELTVFNGTTANNVTIKPMVLNSLDNTTYEQYQETTYPVNLGNIELCKKETYQDRIYKQNNKWYLYKAIGKVTLNGSETGWTDRGADTNTYRTSIDYIISTIGKSECISNNFKWFSTMASNSQFTNNDIQAIHLRDSGVGIGIRIDKNIASTLADFKTWLSTHNTIVYYPLATPTTTEITDTTLIGQLEAISKQLSYKGQTNIIVSGNLPVIINVETLKDLSTEETPVASVTRFQSVRPTIIQPEINNIEEQPEEIEEEISEQE